MAHATTRGYAGNMANTKRVHLLITGRVQGVAFRANADRTARSLGLSGWARNLASGQVEIVAEGSPEAVDRMIRWSHVGPMMARVESVEVRYDPPTGEFTDFTVR